ncbi:MAG: serine/threonine protein kinase [Verrucomicrobia bacterium]|nr:serine/threonine protein kinase [Verrucomicrobiota bacterium]MCH8513623.1 serine/threonine protein kinase [Kiritimatiellia bacterium]
MDPNANTLGIFTEHVRQIGCPHCGAELDVGDFEVFENIVCPACQKEIKVPGRLGSLILIEELGRGAMGCVYLAQDETLNRLVALKVMRREYGDDPKMLETLQKEAQAMATLNHPNVVQVYSFGREQHQPYFVMELLQGERLDEMMADGGIVPEARMMEIGLDVAKGLQAAHNAGLTHGDIKPANILMDQEGVGKVVDFGLARFMESGDEIEVWGTPYYIAPEKARKKGEDSRSDQYSLGATMFHALAGKPPFDGANPTKVVIASLKQETPNLIEINPDVTPKTSAVIRRMMDKTPSRRYPTYASLLADMQLALDAARQAEEDRRRAGATAGREIQEKKKKVWLPALAGFVLVMAVGAGALVYMKSGQPVEVIYSGPDRQLHVPILEAEENQLRAAVQGLQRNNAGQTRNGLVNAAREIPAEHAAKGWYQFLAAGMMIYAQQPDAARALLEAAANQDPIIFDGGRVPAEDPRLLAQKALGTARSRDLTRAMRDAQPYYAHLLELAAGYEFMLQGRANDAARHFRAYGEFTPSPGMGWPYVLQPLSRQLHSSRTPIEVGDISE